MHKEVKELVDWAENIGFALTGTDGRGHYVLEHSNGERYPIAATPSDWRGVLNAKANLRKIAGAKNDSPKAGRSRKRPQSSGFSIDVAKREQGRFTGVNVTPAEKERVAKDRERAAWESFERWAERVELNQECTRSQEEIKFIKASIRRLGSTPGMERLLVNWEDRLDRAIDRLEQMDEGR